jgi:hypothetical protein
MKRATCVLALAFAPLLAIGCDSPDSPAPRAPPAPIAPSQPGPAPPETNTARPVPTKYKRPGLYVPATPTSPRATF